MRSIPGRLRSKHPGLQPFAAYGAAFKARLAGRLTLAGDAPGPADAQLWGIVAVAKVPVGTRPSPWALGRRLIPSVRWAAIGLVDDDGWR